MPNRKRTPEILMPASFWAGAEGIKVSTDPEDANLGFTPSMDMEDCMAKATAIINEDLGGDFYAKTRERLAKVDWDGVVREEIEDAEQTAAGREHDDLIAVACKVDGEPAPTTEDPVKE